MDRYENVDEIGEVLRDTDTFRSIQLVFILVVKTAEEDWLPGSREILNKRLTALRKIWDIKIAVLNEDMAREYGLLING